MMQKSFITYMTLAAPLLPGADAVQSCLFGRRGVKTSPEDPIPAKLAIWNLDNDLHWVNPSLPLPKQFKASVVGKSHGWISMSYTISFQDAENNGKITEKRMTANQLRAMFGECAEFKEGLRECKGESCLPSPWSTARKRVAFMQGWFNGRKFYDAEKENSIRRFSASLTEQKWKDGNGGHADYDIQFNGKTSKTVCLNADQIRDLFGYQLNGKSMTTIRKNLSKWLEGKNFYTVWDEDAEEFDFLPKTLSSETAEQSKETPEQTVSHPHDTRNPKSGKKTSKQSPFKRGLYKGARKG